jgi:phytoene dehydrogenase-like protein
MPNEYDVVIIGAGHNGLVTAGYLGRAGLRTLVLESRHMVGGVGGKRGLWGFVRGGMGGITQAMAASGRSVGVEIRTGARVAKILARDGRASGVALANGEEIRARVVASNADPKVTFLKLAPHAGNHHPHHL